jgi:hypothetical protein
MFPLDPLIAFNKDETQHFYWLQHDRAYLQSVLLTAFGVDDLIQHRQLAPMTRLHLHRTIVLLSQELAKDAARLSPSTIYIIMALAIMAGVFGDHAAAQAHLSGLGKIVAVLPKRGTVATHPKTLFKIDQIELSQWLSTGNRPTPFQSVSCIPNSNTAIAGRHRLLDSLRFDPSVACIYHDLRCISELLNQSSHRSTPPEKLDGAIFRGWMYSIQNRLLVLADSIFDNTIDELLVVGMLLFLSTAFRLPEKRNTPHAYAIDRLQRLFTDARPSNPAKAGMYTWCIMIGAISVLDVNETWVRGAWRKIGGDAVKTWETTKSRLQDVLWIECLHDLRGEKAFQMLWTP